MRAFWIIGFVVFLVAATFGQSSAQKVFDTEKAFESAVAEKGINAAFVEFFTPTGVFLDPFPVNGRERFGKRPATPAALTWNPTRIEVASSGMIAFSIGNSIYRAKGKDDPNAFYGHYITVWSRMPNGDYRAVLDAGIDHEKPTSAEPVWKDKMVRQMEKNVGRSSAADSSTVFYETVDKIGSVRAYKIFLADDVILLRQGMFPIVGKDDAVDYLKKISPRIKFPRRKAFIESADLAYVYDKYSILDKKGAEIESGGFVQIWKFRKGKWLIAAEAWIPAQKQ